MSVIELHLICNEITLFLDHSFKSNNKTVHEYNWKTTKMKGASKEMSSFLEQYGTAIFTLVLVAILIAFAGPLGMKIKNATTEKVSTTEEIGCDEVYVATTGRPKPPKEVMNYVYACLYQDGELVFSSNPITETKPVLKNFGKCSLQTHDSGTVMAQRWNGRGGSDNYYNQIKTATFLDPIRPTTLNKFFDCCRNLTTINNIENLYTDKCTDMRYVFTNCDNLKYVDLSYFEFDSVKDIEMFYSYQSITVKGNSIVKEKLKNYSRITWE